MWLSHDIIFHLRIIKPTQKMKNVISEQFLTLFRLTDYSKYLYDIIKIVTHNVWVIFYEQWGHWSSQGVKKLVHLRKNDFKLIFTEIFKSLYKDFDIFLAKNALFPILV